MLFRSSTVSPRSGDFAAALGQISSLGSLYQPLPTLAGQSYFISLWLIVTPDSSGEATPNVFRVQWNGKNLFAAVNLPDNGWNNLQFIVSAAGSNSVLQFLFQDVPAALGLDDVSVTTIPTPVLQPVTLKNGSINLSWNSLPGLAYQVQYKTGVNQSGWTNLGSPILASTSTTSLSDPVGSAAHYYRVIAQLPNP